MREIAPSINFRPLQASLHIGASASGKSPNVVHLSLMLESREDVITLEQRSIKAADWSIRLLEESVSDIAAPRTAIGHLTHIPEDATPPHQGEACQATVVLSRRDFRSLSWAIQAGRLPDWLNMKVANLTFGSDIDGRSKVWDVDANKIVPIREISIRIPLANGNLGTRERQFIPDDAFASLPASSASVADLRESLMAHLTEQRRKVQGSLNLIAALLLALTLVVLLR